MPAAFFPVLPRPPGHVTFIVMRRLSCILLLLACIILMRSTPLFSEQHEAEVAASPQEPWGDFTVGGETEKHPWWVNVLLWAPNRIMDFIDIFRIDAGIGPAYGGVVRISKHGQAGYRAPSPASVRFGLFGRRAPYLVETSKEYGIGPGFVKSNDRRVCNGEIGAGLDLLIISGYAGICMEEVLDFAAGLFFIDTMKDDLR